MALVLVLWVAVPYFVLQRLPVGPATIMPATALERWVPFDERATWLYLSLFALIPLPPLLMASARQLRQYALGVACIGLVSNGCFLALPTSIARPDAGASDAAYRFVLAVDTERNACPSLHASLAVFTALCGERLLRELARTGRWRAALWAWTVAILYATLATRQHVLADLAGGALVALLAYLATYRRVPAATALGPPPGGIALAGGLR